MRLINADALLKAINEFPYGYRGMIESEIENQPTVDAIPIEFIRGEIARMNQGANRYLSECATYAEDLENLIMEWERWGK